MCHFHFVDRGSGYTSIGNNEEKGNVPPGHLMLTSSQAHRTGTMIAAPLYPPFSRNFDDEQDYADEKNSSRASIFDSQALPPLLRWKRGIAQHHHSSLKDDHKLPLTVKTLIVGFQGGGASYAHTLFNLSNNGDDNDSTTSGNSTEENAAEWVGTLVLPGCGNPTGGPSGSALWGGGAGDSLEAADPHNLSCNIFRKKRGACSVPEGEDEGCGDVAIVSCGYCVPALAAHAWARVLLENISAEVVVVFTSVAVEPGRSEGWEGAKLLATSQAEERDDCLEVRRMRAGENMEGINRARPRST